MGLLRLGVIATSLKEHERRVAIHPQHLAQIDEDMRHQLIFETGYGDPFGVSDKEIAAQAGGIASRDELFERCDILALPKPMHEDVQRMRPHQALWGWCHCVQDPVLTQMAIDRQLTLITWESMNIWDAQGGWQSHVFRKNNEIAGFAGVLHATSLLGIAGYYGRRRKAVVIHYGSSGQGALLALQGMGISDITLLTVDGCQDARRKAQAAGVSSRQLSTGPDGRPYASAPAQSQPLIEVLATSDIIVNSILQDPEHPLMFLPADEIDRLKPGCLIIDISCDAGMGFSFARPTTFDEPMVQVGRAHYYAVDHTPSYLWDSASWEISAALLPFLSVALSGPEAWEKDETIRRAIEIQDGVIQNEKIVSFQKRKAGYPHAIQGRSCE